MLDYYNTHIKPLNDQLAALIKRDLQAIQASADPTDEELQW